MSSTSTHLTSAQVRNLRRGTRATLTVGVVASIAANVLHSITRPGAAGLPGWQIVAGALLAGLAPAILLLASELVTRIPIARRGLGLVRAGATSLIGLFAAWVSYWHMAAVASMLGESGNAQYIYPLMIDGLMIVASISLNELEHIARHVHVVESTPVVDPARSRAARTGWQTRKANNTTKRAPAKVNRPGRSTTRKGSPVQEIEALTADAPVSPAPAGR